MGEYSIGEMVVPRRYKKLILNSNGTLKEVQFTVSGRKRSLNEIRRTELERCEQLGVVRGHTDHEYENTRGELVIERLRVLGENGNHAGYTPHQRRECLMKFERTRHLRMWGDGSTILNYGHLLYLVMPEMKVMAYGDMDVPALVEKPQIYILGRYSAKEVDQLAYVDTRRECLDQLSNNLQTSKGVPVVDVMRFFHGDGPEQQFESGEQTGANNGCSGCSGDSRRYRDLVYCFRNLHLSLADRCNIVKAGPAGRRKRNGGIRPFKNMTVAELRAECAARGLCDEGVKKELQETLKEHLKGVQRVPSLLINEQDKSMEDINLGMNNFSMAIRNNLLDTETRCGLKKGRFYVN